MKYKILALILVIASILAAGCIGDTGEGTTEPEIPTEPTTPVDDSDNMTSGDNDTSEEVVEPAVHSIRLEHYLARPDMIEINKGDTVYWNNWQNDNGDRRQFTLVSEDGLWENSLINYGMNYHYTFNEEGSYNYSILGWQRMHGTVIVK